MRDLHPHDQAAVTREFGYTPWGMDIVRLAEPTSVTVPNKFLPRARSIARNGGVALTMDGRLVRSTVHRGSDASVTHIEFTPMAPQTAGALRELLHPSQEPDDRTHASMVAAGHSPAPVIANVDCSCTARTPMCVHLFATLYTLATHVDNSPRLALAIQAAATDTVGDDNSGPDQWIPLQHIDIRSFYGPQQSIRS